MEQIKRCMHCGYDTHVNNQFCPNCGGNQFYSPTVQCPVCGKPGSQGLYCAHCGADLVNPGNPVWRTCAHCGEAVHITYANCPRCGAPNLPPSSPKPRKKGGNTWVVFLLIPIVLFMLIGIGLGISDAMQKELPQVHTPKATTSASSTNPSDLRPTWPKVPDDTTPSTSRPDRPQPTWPQPTDPAPTEPRPAEPKPTEPQPPEPEDNIPAIYQDNHYLSSMNGGYCENMAGEMVVMFLFVNDPTDGWSDTEQREAETALLDELRTLLAEAEAYGAELDIGYVFSSVTIDTEFNRYTDTWKEAAMLQTGLLDDYEDQDMLEAYYEVDNVPVVFLVDEPGRSFANFFYMGNGFECVTICERDYSALRHELCHVFGARDMYFPQETVEAAKQYLPDGIMYGDCEGTIDPLTAFVIGWTNTLSTEALAFLRETNDLTKEYIEDAKQQDQLTGYGTRYFDGGYYEGYMINGEFHGSGTCYWDDGYTYTGEWLYGSREGYGVLSGPDGYRYEGYWRNGKQHGTGTATFTNGDSYAGDYVDGERHGKGTYTWVNGAVYTGDWVHNERTGKGTITWADGSYYIGDFKDGQLHGKGERYYSSYGTKYIGDFVNGKRHGWGIYHYADGRIYEGRWENDVRVD